jgi:hypothetical protein
VGLRELLESSSTLFWQISEELDRSWFAHIPASRAVAPPAWIDEELEAQ